ncbi:predicted protein [Uncinocarpus reesii 1704]|uniref:Uncharacterized protein n=1 Tax=Uncinocarpus reesii (strain UAMH 1704) TaxID=336963 RepID=C4JSP0_UNCRE|nr:uncharacterized protein UREG_05479 [Uncinocarpus reesii 1704]EEP80637.1 predicted protein [Uncinocarpus reesii 1704]
MGDMRGWDRQESNPRGSACEGKTGESRAVSLAGWLGGTENGGSRRRRSRHQSTKSCCNNRTQVT